MLQAEYPGEQVYEHVEPLQLSVVAFAVLQTSPQALQSLVVFRSVHVLPHVVSVHVHEPFMQVGVGCAQAVTFCHAPVELQVCDRRCRCTSSGPGRTRRSTLR